METNFALHGHFFRIFPTRKESFESDRGHGKVAARTVMTAAIRSGARLPSLLCLDAPCVAVAWSLFFDSLYQGEGTVATHGGLFCSVWTIYLLDRIVDATAPGPRERQSVRHQFARRHTGALRGLLLLSVAGVFAALFVLPARFLGGAGGAGIAVCLYFLALRRGLFARLRRLFPAKEAAVAIVFATGCLIAADAWRDPGAVWGALFLGLLAGANCLLISRAEKEEDARTDPASYFGAPRTRSRLSFLIPLGSVLVLAPLAALSSAGTLALVSAATALSLFLVSARCPGPEVQCYADLVLLLPFPVLWFL